MTTTISRCWQLSANTSDGPIVALGWSTGLGPVRSLFANQMGIRFQDVRARRRSDLNGTHPFGTISILWTTTTPTP